MPPMVNEGYRRTNTADMSAAMTDSGLVSDRTLSGFIRRFAPKDSINSVTLSTLTARADSDLRGTFQTHELSTLKAIAVSRVFDQERKGDALSPEEYFSFLLLCKMYGRGLERPHSIKARLSAATELAKNPNKQNQLLLNTAEGLGMHPLVDRFLTPEQKEARKKRQLEEELQRRAKKSAEMQVLTEKEREILTAQNTETLTEMRNNMAHIQRFDPGKINLTRATQQEEVCLRIATIIACLDKKDTDFAKAYEDLTHGTAAATLEVSLAYLHQYPRIGNFLRLYEAIQRATGKQTEEK
ncbi:MAG: hypothetical protein ACM3IJ_04930 [Candidatus Levyibacteriota bacterium]